MLDIFINLATGKAQLAQATTIKAGGALPVQITFSSNPGASPVMELAIGPNSSTPAVYAYLATWSAQSGTVYTGTLDANDSRLIDAMVGKSTQTMSCETTLTVGGVRRVFANFPVSVEPPIITGPETSEGGPTYYSDAQVDALLASYLTSAIAAATYARPGVSAPQWMPDITGLTGGEATDLDSIESAALAGGYLVAVVIDGALRFYRLAAGTTAEASPHIIRPDDYESSTNEKIWIQVI